MSTSRQPVPRKLPNSAATAPKPQATITLKEWEEKTGLGAVEERSVALLREACEAKPMPLKFQELNGISRPATPVQRLKLATQPGTPSTRPGTPQPSGSRPTNRPLHWKQPISTPEQFHDWFAKLERSVQQSQESHFREHLAKVASYLDRCNRLLELVETVSNEVDTMLEQWQNVEEGGKNLQQACEKLLDEKAQLIELVDGVSSRLEYFQELDSATRLLNRPGEAIVLNPDFLLMTERVDICLEFLRNNRHYKEADLYIMRYQQCLTRAMTLIQMHFLNSIKASTSEIQKRLSDKDLSTTARHHLLYTKFQSLAPSLAPLLSELERRVRAKENDLDSLLSECQTSFCSTRKSLLFAKVVEDVRGLDPARSELVELTRSGCAYLKQLCSDEFDLYRMFFKTGENELYGYLETLCDLLYDDLRPRILHEQRLSALCDVCTILQALMILDVQPPSSSDSEPEDSADLSPAFNKTIDASEKTIPFALRSLQTTHLLQMILQDAQTRLVFRTQAILQAEVRYYVPKPEDLDYPGKLLAAVANGHAAQNGLTKSVLPLPSAAKQATWYPTLHKTLSIISQIHDCVKPGILSDIAQEAVIICSQSLIAASQTLASKNTQSSSDAHMFLIRHLLILKEMTANLDFELTERAPEGITVSNALGSLFRGASAFTGTALFTTLGVPIGAESMLDARMEIDKELRTVCEKVIEQCAKSAMVPIRTFMEQCRALVQAIGNPKAQQPPQAKSNGTLSTHDFAKPENLLEILDSFRKTCERETSWWMKHLRLYLENEETVQVLVTPLQNQIAEDYGRFRNLVGMEYSKEIQEKVMTMPELWSFLRGICT